MSAQTKISSGRNESMECFKLVASFFVLLIHIKFPEPVGDLVTSLARFAVPVFFAISGYFSYQTRADRLLKRIFHIARLYIAAIVICAVLGGLTAVGNGESLKGFLWGYVPGTENLAKLMLLQDSFFTGSGFAWYLLSIGISYVFLWLYVPFFGEEPVDYRPLYIIGVVLMALHLLMGEMTHAAGVSVPYMLYRNGLFMGLPLFTLGIFIREHGARILANYRLSDWKLLGIVVLGFLMTVVQWKGVGTGELPVGVLVQVVAWMLLLSSHPTVKTSSRLVKTVIANLGTVSTVVYLVHYPLLGIYTTYLLPRLPMLQGAILPWARPIVIFLLSAAAGALWAAVQNLFRKKKR